MPWLAAGLRGWTYYWLDWTPDPSGCEGLGPKGKLCIIFCSLMKLMLAVLIDKVVSCSNLDPFHEQPTCWKPVHGYAIVDVHYQQLVYTISFYPNTIKQSLCILSVCSLIALSCVHRFCCLYTCIHVYVNKSIKVIKNANTLKFSQQSEHHLKSIVSTTEKYTLIVRIPGQSPQFRLHITVSIIYWKTRYTYVTCCLTCLLQIVCHNKTIGWRVPDI